MGLLVRSSFTRGWVPDADAIRGPIDGLLRADNCILDELGVVGLRPGSSKINGGAFADTDIHSLFTAILNGTRYRMAGATDAVYANGVSLASGVAGSGDIAFGSHLGQILFGRSTTKKKYDGATVRNWGLSMTGAAPSVVAVTSDGKTFATGDSGEAPAFVVDEDNGTGATFANGQDGSANGAIVLHPSATSNRGTITKTFGGATDFTAYDSGGVGRQDDLVRFYLFLDEPNNLVSVTLQIDVNAGDFQEDYYTHEFSVGDRETLGPRDASALPTNTSLQGPARRRVRRTLDDEVSIDAEDIVATPRRERNSWSRLSVRRGEMTRVGTTSAKDWTTVRAIRFILNVTGTTTARFDLLRIYSNPQAGAYKWCYVYVYNSGTYVGLSAPSPLSPETQMQSAGATVTIPADGARDSQANECWVFRMGGVMDAFYRTAVKTGVSGTGSFTVSDPLSDVDAMTVNVKLETDNAVPPDSPIDIEGPYYDRTFVLTATTLYPSRRLNPDSFAAGQAVKIAGADETAYWVKKALGGLYIGTSRDIYRIDGTGGELPDGTIDFTKTPLNIDHPPISVAVAQDGNLLVYLASDGWRALAGAGSQALSGGTSLLYRGKTRHDVSPVNLATGRFGAAIAKGELVAITPEGSSTTTSTVLYRHVFRRDWWYRHTYPRAWRSIAREPDGTLIAGDNAGFVWVLDTGTQDDGTNIDVVLRTIADDDAQPFTRKDPIDLRAQIDTGGVTATMALHVDGSSSAAATVSASQSGMGPAVGTLESVAASRQFQLRLSGSFSTFRFGSFAVNYVGLPVPIRGELPRVNFGDGQLKTFSGFQIRICTLGVARTITPILDGVAQTPLSVTSSLDEATDVTYQFPLPPTAVEVALLFDGDVEIYDWTPLITTRRPLGVRAWDSGPLDLGVGELVWIRRIRIKVVAGADLVVTPYFDDNLYTPSTISVGTATGVPTVLDVFTDSRVYKGKVPRVVITSTQPFYPYWLEFMRRETADTREKRPIRLSVAMGAVA